MNVIPNFETNENASLDEALLREFYNDSLVIQEFQDFANLIQSDEGGLLQELLSEIPTNKQFVEDLHASTSNYAIEEIPYKSIEIVIGGNNDIDNQQPSTSSSLVSSHPESLQDAKIYARIRELREAGLWSSTRLPKCEDPPRRKTHWDYLLEEVQWIAKDFSHERKVKLRWAKQFAYNAKMTWRKHYGTSKEVKKHVDEEREAKRICGVIARMVRDFWTNVDKVVDFRANEIVESKKRRALDQHLDFLVGAATSILRDSPVIGSLHSERSLRLNDELSEYDGETDEEEEDDESTLDKEEKHLQQAHVELEVSELSKEANMELDEILTTLPAGYLKHMEQLGYKLPSGQQELDDEESMDDSVTMQSGELCSRLDEKPDLQNVDYSKLNSDKSEDRREQLDNIAEAALQFQPKGYTLETTEIKTEVPFLLEGTLREYQLVGLDWLVTLYEKNLNGILADEMGLGKTIQTIALLAHLACSRAIWGPHLIIVPTSVILNWEMELKKWCPSLKVLTYFGTAKERAEKRKGWSKSNAFHVCVTSYKLATQDARAFKKKAWQYVILDEAQNIKNFKSQRWQILLGLRSRRRLLLTGTPLQNNLMELWALLHFLMPHVFASHDDFKEWFHNPFSGMVEGTTEVDKAIVDRLHKVLRPFVLRRLKKDVEKQLPSKSEKVIPCSLSKRQRFLYNEFLSKRSTVENLKSGNMLSVLGIIIQLRKCCNHPNLFEPRPVVSPLVVQPTSSQFPSIVFPLRSELEFSTPNHLIEIPNAFSSYWTWDFSENMSKIDEQSATNVEERVPVIEKTVKFNRGEDGGHFFKVDEVICSDQNGESAYIDDSADIPHTEFLNNTRKRRIPSPNTESDDTAGINQRLTLLSVTKQGSESALFNAANLEIQGALRRRNEEYRRISLYLNDARRIMCLKEGPVLCEEVRTLASLTDPNQGSAMVKFFKNEKRRNNLDEILEAQLFDKVNELISQRLLEWLEISMSRFLLCVRKIFINELRTEPIVTAHDRYEYGLSQVRVLPLLRTKFKSPLTDKAMVYSELEFPELRLIEYDCGKLQVLARLLEQLYENKHRCLIFTQMSRMLDILQAFLSYHNYKYFRLDGATHISQRQAMMERFNADESVFCFILSTRSGGIGVNLTGADTVVFYDSDWNPTMDAQAQDRCHRIGQTRNVTIYRLISERTIEENILTKSMQKRRLGEMAIDEGEFTPDFFKSAGNLRELFSNEESVANLIMPCKDQVTSAKDVEKAMLCVEDKQDVVAAEMAEKETKAEAAEFDENMIQTTQNYDLRDIDSPSEQYMELISGLKPVERYAVNFLANEYRPVLDKEFEETEALLRAKQRELLEAHNGEEPMEITEDYAKSDDVGSIDITYDVNSLEEMGFVFDMPFEDIPIWMPPSPPISEAGHPLDLYSPIDGALLYLPKPIPESELPPLPPLISSFDVSPRTGRISPRKIFGVVSRTDVKRHMTGFGTQKAPNGRISREGQQRLVDRKEQQYVRQSAERTAGGMLSPPESAPNTPMAVPSVPTTANTPAGVDPINAQTATTAEVPRTSEKLPPAMSQSPTVKSSLSTLDESIESTLRKSRKHLQSTVPHYLTRNIGTPPQRPMEPLLTDRSKTVYKLLCPEWRNSPNPTPITSGEPPDYEGQAWNAHEDRRLLKAICVKHSLTTEMVTRCSGLQINWDFVSQYVNLGTNVHRSPRQCALRYINFVLRCDDIVEEGPKKGSSAQRRQRSSAAAPHSVVVDYHYCVQTAATVVRRRTGQMAEVAQIRRRANSVHERAEQSQSQLLCLAGRLPPQQEFRLSELGARYSNAMRASDVLDLRRQNQKRRQRQQQMASQQHGR